MDSVVAKTKKTKSAKSVKVQAPARIDLAGGTLDLWPLFLYAGGCAVVNMAIDVFATAEATLKKADREKYPAGGFTITSRDLMTSKSYPNLEALKNSLKLSPSANPLRWVNRVVYESLHRKGIGTKSHLLVTTYSDAPPGSGLGGSSVLGIALAQALLKVQKLKTPKTESEKLNLQQWVRDLEAQEIDHPAGEQDYIPALFGGLLVFSLGAHHRSVTPLPSKVAKRLSKHIGLLYTGKPHHSGLNNWSVFKAFHENDSVVRNSLFRIGEISKKLALVLSNPTEDDWIHTIPSLLNEEWAERIKLSPAICPQVLKSAWDWAESNGAQARKACGAGGGGCMMFYFSSEEQKLKAQKQQLPDPTWKWLSSQVTF